MRRLRLLFVVLSGALAGTAHAGEAFDAAAAFGARPSVLEMSLSPDGNSVAYLSPTAGQGSILYTLRLENGAKPQAVMSAGGSEERLARCSWISNSRLTCTIYRLRKDPAIGILPFTRVIAIDANGKNFKLLSNRETFYSRGLQLGGGDVIDMMPGKDAAVLMTRVYLPNDHLGTRLGSSSEGLGVDEVDTTTLDVRHVEPPQKDAVDYITDGRGSVRIMGLRRPKHDQDTGVIDYLYRTRASHDWKDLGQYNSADGIAFNPYAVDADRDLAYGFKKKDGRYALYSVSLDGNLQEQLVYARPDVDVTSLVQIGRQQRTVGVSFATDKRVTAYFDPDIERLVASLSRALHGLGVQVVDSSADEGKLLVFAGSDTDPGAYYIFDRKTHHLQTFLVVRSELEGVKLAAVSYVEYPAADGTKIPAYMTMPPGLGNVKGSPAIVLPHGGPSARDEWGFDWLAQFYAARGYVVLQPNYRGSAGYGDDWLEHNGFQSWPVAISDVLAAGKWLVSEGIADPAKLAIVGWSYGGYAALQSAVTEPGLYKAVVAVAPVTDLPELIEEHRDWSDFGMVRKYVGEGTVIHDGSPREHADKIAVPVMLFHGAMDSTVSIEQSLRMADRLKAAGKACELVTWDDLDHQLDDSQARARLLRDSDAFLRKAMGMAVPAASH